jgi:cytochrome c
LLRFPLFNRGTADSHHRRHSQGDGPQAFERCIACHGDKADLGPSLSGVVGRRAASRDDFRYSRALSRCGVVWTEQNLDAFLRAPEQFVPGTRMPFEGIALDAERTAVIQHLKSLK